MTTEKMTVHKALCELKTLDSRIQKCMQQNWTSSLKLSQRRPSHDGFGFYKSALFAGLSGR